MFLEPQLNDYETGWIEVVCGSMFSGKTEELIRRLKRAKFANMKVEIFKPLIDTRYHEEHIVSHDENYIPSTPVESSHNILLLAADVQVVGIDEAQFFDDNLPHVCNELANRGTRVIIAGLDMDFKGKPFGPMPHLMAIAEYVTKVHAVCVRTGTMAHYSYRKSNETEQVKLGEKDIYEPLSRRAYLAAKRSDQ
ncbi:MAG: thymidine kinase [Bacteroidetes bacterium]|nr:thymidine kinase [Bacteroidota bacterium]